MLWILQIDFWTEFSLCPVQKFWINQGRQHLQKGQPHGPCIAMLHTCTSFLSSWWQVVGRQAGTPFSIASCQEEKHVHPCHSFYLRSITIKQWTFSISGNSRKPNLFCFCEKCFFCNHAGSLCNLGGGQCVGGATASSLQMGCLMMMTGTRHNVGKNTEASAIATCGVYSQSHWLWKEFSAIYIHVCYNQLTTSSLCLIFAQLPQVYTFRHRRLSHIDFIDVKKEEGKLTRTFFPHAGKCLKLSKNKNLQ